MTAQPQTLNYGKPAHSMRSWLRRRLRLILAGLALAATVALVGPPLRRHLGVLTAQRVALTHVPPKDHVAVRAWARATPTGSSSHAEFTPPRPWVRYAEALDVSATGLPFLGERRNTHGRRVVIAGARVRYRAKPGGTATTRPTGALSDYEMTVTLTTSVLDPATVVRGTPSKARRTSAFTTVVPAAPESQPFQLFAGRANPLDPRRITFAYQSGAVTGTIDARLRDDDGVDFSMGTGPATAPP